MKMLEFVSGDIVVAAKELEWHSPAMRVPEGAIGKFVKPSTMQDRCAVDWQDGRRTFCWQDLLGLVLNEDPIGE